MTIADHLSVMDENYLIALSNKGTFKRAVKELDEAGIMLVLEPGSLEADFADGTKVMIPGDIRKYTCSCPARDVCKHLIMAVLAFQKQQGGNPEAATPVEPELDFSRLLTETGATLEKKAGKQPTKKAFFQVEIDGSADISESSTVSITLRSGFKVHFLSGCGIEDARCTCKASGVCTHKVEAVLYYIRLKTGSLPEGVAEKTQHPDASDLDMDSIAFMQDFVSRFLETGLARMSASSKQQFEHLSVVAHSRKLAYLENIAKRIAAQLELMGAKSARANTHALLNNLCEFVNVCRILRSGKVSRDLLGAFKDEYDMIPPVTLHGLGAEGWQSDTGYVGITSYFYCEERREIVQYSSVLPSEFQPDFNVIYRSAEIPGVNAYMTSICRSTMKLVNGRLSRRKRLSFTRESAGTVWDSTSEGLVRSISIDDFSLLPDLLWGNEERTLVAVIAPAEYSGYSFDSIEQTASVNIRDSKGRQLSVGLKYKDSDKTLINNLQKFMEVKDNTERMLVKIFVDKGRLRLFPLALHSANKQYSSGIINLNLDQLLNDKQ